MGSTRYSVIKARLILLCYFSGALCYAIGIIADLVDKDYYNTYIYFVLSYFEKFALYLWICLMAFHTKLCMITKIATVGVMLAFLSDLLIVIFKLGDSFVYYTTVPILVISFSTIILTQLYKWITTP